MAAGTFRPAFLLCILYTIFTAIFAEVLTPPTFNLAKGRNITATATCGYEGAEPGPVYLELYCRLTGATGNKKDDTREIIQVGVAHFKFLLFLIFFDLFIVFQRWFAQMNCSARSFI